MQRLSIANFCNYLRYERNYSELTVQTYQEALAGFQLFFEGTDSQLSWQDIDKDIVRNWMEHLMDQGQHATTINKKLCALRSFFRFALRQGLLSHNPTTGLRGPKKEKPLPQFATEQEMDRLIDDDSWHDNISDLRARTLLILIYETGLRRAEVASLNTSSIDLDQRQLKVTGKRNKQRIVPFGEELATQLKEYLEVRSKEDAVDAQALFLNNKGQRIHPVSIYKLVRRHLQAYTNLKKCSPHVLRHSYATALLNHGARLETIQRLLGHEQLSTTAIYTHTTFEQLRENYEKAHPRA